MENASKALIIAGGVILAVIIMSLIAYFFAGVSEWPQQQDDTDYKEQLAKFNQEYEIYEKSAMYGTDVISCLNKVVNFDEKYVEEDEEIRDSTTGKIIDYKGGWLSGTKYGNKKEFAIDVSVTLKNELEESLEVYYIDSGRESSVSTSNKEQLQTNESEAAQVKDAFGYISDANDKIKNKRETAFLSYYMNDGKEDPLVNGSHSISYMAKDKQYNLLKSETEIDTSKELYKLIKLSKFDLKVTIKNPDSSTLRQWSTVIWKTPLYDFKSKRFKCDGIEYNVQTGRVNKISFSEI